MKKELEIVKEDFRNHLNLGHERITCSLGVDKNAMEAKLHKVIDSFDDEIDIAEMLAKFVDEGESLNEIVMLVFAATSHFERGKAERQVMESLSNHPLLAALMESMKQG